MKNPISLAEKSEGPSMLTMSEPPSGVREHFPQVTLRETGGLKLPDEGTITLEFKKVRSEEEIHDGKKVYRCTIALHAILDVEDTDVAKPATNKNKDSGDALDALRDTKMKDDESEDY